MPTGRWRPRVAAIFTLEQLLGRDSIGTLVKLAADPTVREFALRALADRREDAASIPAEPFLKALADPNPRVRLQAVVALGRLGKVEAAPALVARTADDDPLVAHVAVKALVALNAAPACLAALGPATPKLAPGAARALQAMHNSQAVDGLIKKLVDSPDAATRRLAFKALCRLDHREADYTGDWWTTRPDTSGPYYKPVAWEQTRRIERALGDALKRADSQLGRRDAGRAGAEQGRARRRRRCRHRPGGPRAVGPGGGGRHPACPAIAARTNDSLSGETWRSPTRNHPRYAPGC